MKKFYTAIVALIICMSWTGEARASHAQGADLSYRFISYNPGTGQMTYEVTATFYRDCSGIPAPSQMTLTYFNTDCSGGTYTNTATLNMVTGLPCPNGSTSGANGCEVSQLCPNAIANSTCNGGSQYPGVQKYVYRATITLPGSGTAAYQCNQWYLSIAESSRNNSNNIVGASGYDLYVEALVNTTINPATGQPYQNSSATFGYDPVPFVCNGFPVSYNNGAIDANGDSLVFQLITPLQAHNSPLTWQSGYSQSRPIIVSNNQFAFNPATGQIDFTPSQTNVDVLALRVLEYRNGVLVGSTIRDVQVKILNCVVPAASMDPIANNNNANSLDSVTVQLCPGTTASWDIKMRDSNGDSIVVKSNISATPSALPGASFTQIDSIRSVVTAHITWTPTVNDTGCHYYQITANTKDCPIEGNFTKTYRACVFNKVTVTPHQAIYCGTPIQLTATGGTNSTWTPMAGLTFNSGLFTPVAAPTQTTTYAFHSDCGTDTARIIFNPPFTMDAGTGGSICQNNAIQLNATVDNLYAPYQILWTPSTGLTDPLTHAPVNNILNPVASPNATTTYTVHFKANTGCERIDTVTVRVNGFAPRIQAKANPIFVCPGQPTQLIATSSPECGPATTPCTGQSTLVTVGTGTNTQAGTGSTYPSIYGNYYKSARHQILIHASELYSQLGSGGQITSLALQVGNNNGGSTCNNFTIRMGCVDNSIDSLTGYVSDNYLTTVFVGNVNSVTGWNPAYAFQTPYNWDGQSNLVIDFCFINTTSGNLNPQMKYTTTPFRSVWCTYSNDPGGQCGFTGVQANTPVAYANYFHRPNIRFNVCTVPLGNANLVWTPSTGPNAPNPINKDTTIAHPVDQTRYVVTLIDPNGCNSSDYVTVYVDTTNRLIVSPDTFICSSTPVQLHAAVTGTANPATLTYTWSAVGGTAPASGTGLTYANPTVTPTGTTLYICTISGGTLPCTITDSARVTMGNNIPVRKVVDSITCAGANNGRITINMNAGTAPYTYTWNPAAAGNPSVLSNLSPATYYLTVTDANHCTGYDTTRLLSPVPLTLRMDSVNENCYGDVAGSVTATAGGGRTPYRYTWSIPGGNASGLTSLTAGLYQVTVTDTSGCTITGQANVTQPAQVTAPATHTNLTGASTHDGTITITASGGTAPYTYTWTCPPGVSVGNVSSATGLDSGYYYIRICDAHGCCVRDTVHITGPPPINVVFTVINNLCYSDSNGVVSAVASGGVGPYTFLWSTGSTSDTASHLAAGTYYLTVTDANGISVADPVTVTSPPALVIGIDSTVITCYGANDGTLDAIPSGGTPNYTVTWNAGSDPLSGLAPGMYTVTVTDANSCVAKDTAYLGQPSQLLLSVATTDSVKCYGNNNGIARLATTGGRPPYSYAWTGSGSGADSATDLSAGPFSVTVTDAGGCSAATGGTIYQPLQIQVTIATTPSHCLESKDGIASATVANGTAPYSYSWDGLAGSTINDTLLAGQHTLLVTDVNGCSTSQPFTIDTVYVLRIALTADSTNCFNGSDGSATVTVANGNGPYTYQWEPSGDANSTAIGLPAGLDTVLVSDMYGCPATGVVEVYEPSEVVVLPYFTNPLCHGDNNGTIWLTASGGHAPYYYTFNGVNYQMTDTTKGLPASPTPADNYLLPVTDARGCVQPVAIHLTDPPALTASQTVTPISCANDANGAIQITPGGGTTPYSYTWSDGPPATDTHSSLGPGTYSVTLTDANGCEKVTTATLVAPPPISTYEMKVDSTHCPGSADGSVHFVVQGGTPASTYAYEYSLNGTTWQTIPDFYDLPAGTYQLHARDSMLCQFDTTITVYQPDPISVAITPQDTSLVVGTSISLVPVISNQTTQGINSYSWTPGLGLTCIDCPVPVATPYETTTYQLVVNYGKNCYANASATIRIEHGPEPYIPNAFSPNGDGTNDRFEVYGTKIKTVSMRVFNRWGEKVFDSMGNQWTGWDGTYLGELQPPSIYVYHIELTYLDGAKKSYDGSITLLR